MFRSRFRRSTSGLLVALLFVLLPPAHAAGVETDAVDAAFALARQRHQPVLVDFYAPWCYSCYYMARHVKTGAEWQRVESRAVVLELDADAPDGAHFMKQWQVKGLPSYLVFDEVGAELGRIPLERTRAQFYPELDAILARGSALATRQAKVVDGGAASRREAQVVLDSFRARNAAQEGLDWWATLPAPVSEALGRDAAVRLALARLELQVASAAGDGEACATIAPRLLAGPDALGCDRAYAVDAVLECTSKLPAERRRALLKPERTRLQALLARRVFVPRPACADARSLIATTVAVEQALGDEPAAAALWDRAIRDARQRLGGAKPDARRDRNLADNLRLYLDLSKRHEELDAWYPLLIAAYPDDYVYAFRFGRSLHERGRDAEALRWLEQAAGKAYGANRLNVALLRVSALQALGRAEEAKRVASAALDANGPFFPELAGKLRAQAGLG